LLVIDIKAGDVRRQQVRRELNSSEEPAYAPGQTLGDQCLSQPGDIVDQNMTVREKCHEKEFNGLFFPHDDMRDIFYNSLTEAEVHDPS
jgi:hypothetical protein